MNTRLRMAYDAELDLARVAVSAGEVDLAFHHLERAHILGQRDTWGHVRSHVWMLRVGFSAGRWREVFGQLVRIVAAALFSRIWVPAGNTGRADVSALKPMPIPADLRVLLEPEAGSWR